MSTSSLRKSILVLMACTTLGCAVPGVAKTTPPEVLSAHSPVADMVESVTPAIVNIEVEGTRTQVRRAMPFPMDPFFDEFFGDFFGGGRDRGRSNRAPREYSSRVPMKAAGTGFIVSRDGKILTNNHVIEDADKISIMFSDGKKKEAKVIGRDPTFDLAVLKVEGKDFPTLTLGDSDKARVGETVIAIGNSLHLGLEPTVTAGVLSAKKRSIHARDFNFEGFLQTDASINPGNSGGPLLDMNGNVIGINTAIIASAQGIGFAIPINMAKQVMDDIVTYGKVRRGQLGVVLQPISEDMAKAFNLKEAKGALIADVSKDSPAAKAGLKRGDIIVKMDGKEVKDNSQVVTSIRQHMEGDTIKLDILRNGKTKKFSVKLAKVDSAFAGSEMADQLGFKVAKPTAEICKQFKLSGDTKGVVVTDVEQRSKAARSGLRPGDVILQADGHDITTPDSLFKRLHEAGKDFTALLIMRDGATYFLPLELVK